MAKLLVRLLKAINKKVVAAVLVEAVFGPKLGTTLAHQIAGKRPRR